MILAGGSYYGMKGRSLFYVFYEIGTEPNCISVLRDNWMSFFSRILCVS